MRFVIYGVSDTVQRGLSPQDHVGHRTGIADSASSTSCSIEKIIWPGKCYISPTYNMPPHQCDWFRNHNDQQEDPLPPTDPLIKLCSLPSPNILHRRQSRENRALRRSPPTWRQNGSIRELQHARPIFRPLRRRVPRMDS